MDSFFKNSYYRINRFFMISIGLWPLKTTWFKKIHFPIVYLLLNSLAFLQAGGLITAAIAGDLDSVLELIPFILIDCSMSVNMFFSLIHANKIKILLEKIYYTWKDFSSEEQKILDQYAKITRKFTIYYAIGCYGFAVPFFIFPLYPIFYNLISQDKKIPLQLVFQVKYFVNVENYYWLILPHAYFVSFISLTLTIALDSMYIIFVQYTCGMFIALRSRLQNIIPDSSIIHFCETKIDQDIIDCATLHNMIIKFADTIESIYSYEFLLRVTVIMLSISFTACQAIEYYHMPYVMIRFLFLTMVQIFHLYIKCWQSQKLIDHSALIGNAVYDANWYTTSTRTKKILYIMLMRSSKLCKITAGKFFEMSHRTFSTIISASASYFTVLTSLR